MDVKNINATLETRKSKQGNNYTVVILKLTPSYEKLVFLDKAELELLSVSSKSQR